jgi:hypothetical protein
MAQMALTFVGSAVGGPIGGFIGNMLGSVIDDALFPSKQPAGRNVQVSTYGVVLPRMYGPENRVAGEVIWWSGLRTQPVPIYKFILGVLPGLLALAKAPQICDVAVAIGEGADSPTKGTGIVQIRKIWANGRMIFNADYRDGLVFTKDTVDGTVMSIMDSVRVYQGNFTQMPDVTMEAALGVNSTPAYRGTAYVVIAGLHLSDFGQALPNFEFLVEAQETADLSAVCLDLAERAGIPGNSVSVSTIAGQPVRGFTVGQQSTAKDCITPLALAYGFDAADQGGNLRFIKRGLPSRGYIITDELAGHLPKEARPEPIHFVRTVETLLPKQVTLIYSDPNFAYQPNSQTSVRTGGSADANVQAQVAIVLTDAEAQAAADRVLWEAWNGRTTATTTVTERWFRELRAGLVYTFDSPVGPEPLRITRVTRGANSLLELELSRDYSEVYTSPNPGGAATEQPSQIDPVVDSGLQLIDCPIMLDQDDNTGFYFATGGDAAGWRGSDVQRSVDGVSFGEIAPVGDNSPLGSVATALPDGSSWVIDNANVLTVTLDDPTVLLPSITEDELLAGGNPLWLGPTTGEGGELLQFMDAVETSPGVWELSGLLRGRKGTEYATATHGPNERLAMLSTSTTKRVDFGPADWNKQRAYRAVTLFGDPTAAPVEQFTNTGEGKRCYAPTHPRGSRNGSNDLTLTWVRRTRLNQPGLGNGSVPLGEAVESYQVDIIVSAVVVRTIASATPSIDYTAAEQTADGITPGDPVSGNIYQISDVRGRGHARAFDV